MSKFTHQVCFRQTLGCKGDGELIACGLPKEASLIGIEAHFKHLVAKIGTQIIIIAAKIEPPVGAYPPKPPAGGPNTERREPGRTCPLPILDDKSDPSVPPVDRLVREHDHVKHHWEYAH